MGIHILGIAGTFMGGIAQLAKAKGFEVTGSDKAIYPPMSSQLAQAGIDVLRYEQDNVLATEPDEVVIGNALSRGHPLVETTLNAQQKYTSGPQWLAENILQDRWVVAVAGTHGKTSTASMVAWILEYADLNPGFLIGGVPENFGVSARLGASPFFVVEADEYDTAFFDKRSKFVHYHPRTCVLNNLEFDHADIFDSLADIQKQFHHLIRTVPANGLVVMPHQHKAISDVIDQGCWTPVQSQGEQGDWHYEKHQADGAVFEVFFEGQSLGAIHWKMLGDHNIQNALSAIAAAVHCGVPPKVAVAALNSFKGIRRRMSLVGEAKGVHIYDDFAHHPTAIQTTLEAAQNNIRKLPLPGQGADNVERKRVIAVFEPRSNTMRMGIHAETLPAAFDAADAVYAFVDPSWNWTLSPSGFKKSIKIADSYDALLEYLLQDCQAGDHVVIMSNGSFGGIHQKLLAGLSE